MATTGLLIGGIVILVVAASGLLGLVRRLFSPAVTGAVILLVGIALAGFTLEEFLGGSPTSPDFASPSTDWARVTTWASLPFNGLALSRIEPAVWFVRLSWITESVAVLMPCPVLAMFSALWLIRFAALAVRASSDTLTTPATTTTATTTAFVTATAPASLRHRGRGD